MNTKEILIRNATIVNEGRQFTGSVLVSGRFIKSVAEGDFEVSANCEVIEATGLLLLPGIIDCHVHFREPGVTHKGDLSSESRAAVAGGVTSFFEMPNTQPQTVTLDLLEQKMALAAGKSLANYSFFLGASNYNINEIVNADPKTVCGVKVFFGASTGNMLVDNEMSLRELFRSAHMPISAHCEHEPTIRKNIEIYRQKYGEDITVKMHPLIRSREACFLSSSQAVNLAREFNTRLHIFHLSTADEMKLFANDIPPEQKRITGEVCVHHLWFDDSYYEKFKSFSLCWRV